MFASKGAAVKYTVLIEFTIDTELANLRPWVEEAALQGWAQDEENGVWVWAEDVAKDLAAPGIHGEVVDSTIEREPT